VATSQPEIDLNLSSSFKKDPLKNEKIKKHKEAASIRHEPMTSGGACANFARAADWERKNSAKA